MTAEIRKQIDGLPIAFTTCDTSGGKLETDHLVYKSDVVELIEKLTKWNKVEDFPNDDNILVIVKTKHKLVDDYDGFDLANYAHGKYWLSSDNLIPIKWKYI